MRRPTILILVALTLLALAVVLGWNYYADDPRDLGPIAQTTPASPDLARGVAADPETARVDAQPTIARIAAETSHAEATADQGVRGRVVDERGAPLPRVHVALLDSVANDPIGKFLARSQEIPELALADCRTGEDGLFALGLRKPDNRKLQLCLYADGYAAEVLGDVAVAPQQWVDIGDVALCRGCTIHGRVTVAGTDLPAPSATVTLQSGNPFLDQGASPNGGWNERRTASAGPDGRYEIRNAPQKGMFRLVATAPGFGRQVRDEVNLDGRVDCAQDFALPRGLSIQGRVTTAGLPIGSAKITAFPKAAEPPFVAQVASDGSFAVHGLREGPHLVQIEAEGFQSASREDVAAGTNDLLFELSPRGRAGVRALDHRGVVLRQYRVSVRRWFAEAGGQIGILRGAPDRVVRLDPPHEVAFVDNLEDGEFVFQVEAQGHVSTLSAPFRIDPTSRQQEVTVQLHRGGAIAGVVTDELGRPVAGASVRTEPDGAAGENPVYRMFEAMTPDRITRTATQTAADGNFVVQPLAHANYQIAIDHPDYCRLTRRGVGITEDRTETAANLRLLRGCAVRGRALVAGVPAQQIQVVLTPQWTDPATGAPIPAAPKETADETSVTRVEAVTNQEGAFVLPRRIPPGVYELRASSLAGSDPGDAFHKILQMKKSSVRLEIRPGQESAEAEVRLDG